MLPGISWWNKVTPGAKERRCTCAAICSRPSRSSLANRVRPWRKFSTPFGWSRMLEYKLIVHLAGRHGHSGRDDNRRKGEILPKAGDFECCALLRPDLDP